MSSVSQAVRSPGTCSFMLMTSSLTLNTFHMRESTGAQKEQTSLSSVQWCTSSSLIEMIENDCDRWSSLSMCLSGRGSPALGSAQVVSRTKAAFGESGSGALCACKLGSDVESLYISFRTQETGNQNKDKHAYGHVSVSRRGGSPARLLALAPVFPSCLVHVLKCCLEEHCC